MFLLAYWRSIYYCTYNIYNNIHIIIGIYDIKQINFVQYNKLYHLNNK